MEVRPGYKRTEVGIIPEEWAVCRLDSLGTGQIPPIKAGPFGSALTKDTYVPTGYKVYGQEQVIRRDHLYGDYFITQQKYRELEACAVRPGDVLLSLVGTAGRLLEVPANAAPGIINPRLIRFSFDNSRVNPTFFRLLFESGHVQGLLERQAQGGTMGVLNAGVLRPFCIQLPPLPEQRAIAAALSDVDALLEGLTRFIAKKRDLKQAAMQQLLTGETRLPGFRGEWEVRTLGDLGTTYGGLSGKTKADFGVGDGQYVTFMNVMTNVVIDCGSFERVRVGAGESQNRVMRGDLLFNGSSETPEEVAMCAVLTAEVPYLFLNSFCFGFRLRDDAGANGLFLAYYLRSRLGRELMKSLAQGSTRYNLSKVALLKASLLLPSHREQTAIAAILSDMDAELSALEARREKTRALKQAMMQELLTGRTRLV